MTTEKQRPLKEGDHVKPYGYCGVMVISHKEDYMGDEPHWFCQSEEYATHFDTYAESDLTLVTG